MSGNNNNSPPPTPPHCTMDTVDTMSDGEIRDDEPSRPSNRPLHRRDPSPVPFELITRPTPRSSARDYYPPHNRGRPSGTLVDSYIPAIHAPDDIYGPRNDFNDNPPEFTYAPSTRDSDRYGRPLPPRRYRGGQEPSVNLPPLPSGLPPLPTHIDSYVPNDRHNPPRMRGERERDFYVSPTSAGQRDDRDRSYRKSYHSGIPIDSYIPRRSTPHPPPSPNRIDDHGSYLPYQESNSRYALQRHRSNRSVSPPVPRHRPFLNEEGPIRDSGFTRTNRPGISGSNTDTYIPARPGPSVRQSESRYEYAARRSPSLGNEPRRLNMYPDHRSRFPSHSPPPPPPQQQRKVDRGVVKNMPSSSNVNLPPPPPASQRTRTWSRSPSQSVSRSQSRSKSRSVSITSSTRSQSKSPNFVQPPVTTRQRSSYYPPSPVQRQSNSRYVDRSYNNHNNKRDEEFKNSNEPVYTSSSRTPPSLALPARPGVGPMGEPGGAPEGNHTVRGDRSQYLWGPPSLGSPGLNRDPLVKPTPAAAEDPSIKCHQGLQWHGDTPWSTALDSELAHARADTAVTMSAWISAQAMVNKSAVRGFTLQMELTRASALVELYSHEELMD